MRRLCLALMSKSILFSSWAKGVQARIIEISIKIIETSQERLDYNMNLDRKDFAIDDPKSHGLRASWLGQRYDQMCRFGVIRSLDIRFRRLGRTVRMRMEDGDEQLAGFAQAAKCGDQFGRVHLV